MGQIQRRLTISCQRNVMALFQKDLFHNHGRERFILCDKHAKLVTPQAGSCVPTHASCPRTHRRVPAAEIFPYLEERAGRSQLSATTVEFG